MNVVLDTNVIISGLLFSGSPGVLVEAIQTGKLAGYTSEALLRELTRILKDKFSIKPDQVKETERLIRTACIVVTPKTIPDILHDKADNQVLAIIHEALIDMIISGDRESVALKVYRGVLIMKPDEFLADMKLQPESDF